jgi:hypothetical protein
VDILQVFDDGRGLRQREVAVDQGRHPVRQGRGGEAGLVLAAGREVERLDLERQVLLDERDEGGHRIGRDILGIDEEAHGRAWG